VRSEGFGLTLGYQSGLAGGRALGGASTDYQATAHGTYSAPLRGLRLSALALPDASTGAVFQRQPGLCGGQSVASFGQATPITLRGDFAWAGSTMSQSYSMGATYTQVDLAGSIHLPLLNGQPAGPGLYATHVSLTAQSPGTCISSGGTFGVANEQLAGTQVAVEPGPLATFDYHELVNHRLGSAYGTGWTIQEIERVYRAGDTAFLVRGDGTTEKFQPRPYPHYLAQ
jgi:hypothetical protein